MRRTSRRVISNNTNNEGTNAALAGGAVGALTGVDNPTLTSCAPNDTSFYCRLTRFFNSVKMILNLALIVIAVIAVIYFGYKWYKNK